MTDEIPAPHPDDWVCDNCQTRYYDNIGIETETGCIACKPTEKALHPLEKNASE